MFDTDELSAELRELRDRSAEVAVSAPPALAEITATGRRLRRRRRFAVAGLSAVGATAAAALVLELVGVGGPAGTTATSRTPGAVGSVAPDTIQTAAFTLISNSDGTVTLIMDPLELFQPSVLQDDLARYGVPALVTPGEVCTSDPAPAGLSQVESFDPGTPQDGATITIDPSAMPADSKLSFGTVDFNGGVQGSFSSLIYSDSYTCTSTPPTDADPHPAREGVIRLSPSN